MFDWVKNSLQVSRVYIVVQDKEKKEKDEYKVGLTNGGRVGCTCGV